MRGASMTKRIGVVCILGLILAITSTLIAADPSFVGTWKLNLSKSQLGGPVYTFEKRPSGVMHYSGGGFDTDFDLAGKDYTMPNGTSIIGKATKPTTWRVTIKLISKVVAKSTITVNNIL